MRRLKKLAFLLFVMFSVVVLGKAVDAKEKEPVEYGYEPDGDYFGYHDCFEFRRVAKNVTSFKTGSDAIGASVFITQKERPRVVLEINPLNKLKNPKGGIYYKTYAISKTAVDFYPVTDYCIFIKNKNKDLLISSYDPEIIIRQPEHTNKKDCKKDKPVVNRKIANRVNQCWSDEAMFAYVKDNSLYVMGTAAFGERPYCFECETDTMKFFEGMGNHIKQIVSSGEMHQTLFVLMKDGSVWGRGINTWHTISKEKENVFYDDFVKIIDTGVKEIAASYSNVAMIKKDGSLWVWGKSIKERKKGSKVSRKESSINPVKIASNVKSVALTDMYDQEYIKKGTTAIVFLKQNGTAYGVGTNERCMFTGKYKQIWHRKPVKLMGNIKRIDVTRGKTLLLTKKNELYWVGCHQFGINFSEWMPKVKKR